MKRRLAFRSPLRFLPLLLLSGPLFYNLKGNYSPFFSQKESEPTTHVASVVPLEPEQQESGLEKAAKECDFDTRWDEKHSADLLKDFESARVILFGINYGDHNGGDPRDGAAVAGALPYFKNAGWNYVAVEGPRSLNQYVGTTNLTAEARKAFGNHWTEFGPVIEHAQGLDMRLIFFYQPEREISTEREEAAFKYLKEKVFDKDPKARMIVYAGAHSAFTHPSQISWLNPTEVKSLGTFLAEHFGDRWYFDDKLVIDVLLQAEKPTIWGFNFDHSFYLGKECPPIHNGEEALARSLF